MFIYKINKFSCSLNKLISRNSYHQFDADNLTKYEDLVSYDQYMINI